MDIQTKFSLGDLVWHIWRGKHQRVEQCNVCKGEGWIFPGGEKFLCPKCSGRRRVTHWEDEAWIVEDLSPIRIRDIRVELTKAYCDTRYMESDSGAGRLYYERRLFPSRAEAEAACADFNERGVTVSDIQDRHQPSQSDSES